MKNKIVVTRAEHSEATRIQQLLRSGEPTTRAERRRLLLTLRRREPYLTMDQMLAQNQPQKPLVEKKTLVINFNSGEVFLDGKSIGYTEGDTEVNSEKEGSND